MERKTCGTSRKTETRQTVTPEFEMLINDPDLESIRGPGNTLIFLDGDQYCCVGPEFISTEESVCYAFGTTKEDAVASYFTKIAS